ncbi:hypothetical protein HOLleu_09386 [Holothuria leucospilota]|uniref:Endonuclease/exonuclease/phosphatase domain-containing protein n=1 Tax=Holothuria leucospilota TaxID=206669 RepID=A0A9Q1CC46_HOLLE|nr:hypothetical protein HOLleu_09386 [Holothuria leucospilota]
MLVMNPFHIISLNETFCDPCFDDGDVQLNDFHIYRKDRNRHGGGVAIYVSSSLSHKLRDDLMDDSVESICVEVKFKATAPILIYSVYRPPNSPVSFFNSFSEMLSKASCEKKEIVTLGDLNCNVDPSVRDANARHLRFIKSIRKYHRNTN